MSRRGVELRWQVVVVRVPAAARAAVEATVPGGRRLQPVDLPWVTRVTLDPAEARETAERLRAAGAVVLVMVEPAAGESAFCPTHPGRIAARSCVRCGAPTCTACRQDAHGDEVCASCARAGRGPRRQIRVRQLFSLFLFAVFLYGVARWQIDQRTALSPRGPVTVAIYQFAPPDEPAAPLIRALNDPTAPGGRSLHGIEAWFNAERARYAGPSDYLQLDLRGPWGREVRPPPLDGDPDWLAPLRAWRYARFFHLLARDQGEDPDAASVRLYIIYARDPGDLASHSRGSADGRIAVAWIDLDEANPAYPIVTVAHELGHTLGAPDLYRPEDGHARHPEGFVEPFAEPLYPQRWAELMAVDRPINHHMEAEVRSLDEVRIGHHSAAAMGWITAEQARVYYSPPGLKPEDHLHPPEAAP